MTHPGSPVLSRRIVLLTGSALMADLVLRPLPLAAAAGKALPEVSFIVVSDTHLGRQDNDSAEKRWDKTAAEIAQSPAEIVLHLGDIVDGGRESQYPIYLATRKKIGKPVHEVPGNHDPHQHFEKHVRTPIDVSVDHRWLRFVLMGNAHTDSHDGFLTAAQLAWLDKQCQAAAAADRYVIVCMHVPAHKNTHPDRGWYVKPGSGQAELYAILAKHKDRVLAMLHGHFHNGIRGWDDHPPLHEIVFPSALYNQDRKLRDKNAPGYSLDEMRPGYTIVTIKDGTMTLKHKPVGEADGASKKLEVAQLKGQ